MNTLRTKALACLHEGRVTVLKAAPNPNVAFPDAPSVVLAYVRSSRPERRAPYVVDGDSGWQCTCHLGNLGQPCGHVYAVRLVTGHHETTEAVA